LTSLLDGAAAYHETQSKASRKRKRGWQNEGSKKKSKNSETDEDVPMEDGETGRSKPTTNAPDDSAAIQPKPVALNHTTCGINAVTKRLEAQVRQARRNVIVTTDPEGVKQVPITLVFVCRADVDPPLLIDHFPPLVAACNSVQSNLRQQVKLVPVPKGSEDVLGAKLGIKRVSVIALDVRIFMSFH
jgi:ribonuclease P/MRP protein subunit POP3